MAQRSIVVVSGGSAANVLVDVFASVAESNDSVLNYIIPISDNGGSSSELIRVFGGPGIGDIRSRLVRLIPHPTTPEKTATHTLFNHRLPPDADLARLEWLSIVEGTHCLWQHISAAKKELIRSFLNTVHSEIIKRARPTSTFSFTHASVGNLFLTGTRLFTGSFEAAIYLLGSITGIPGNVQVLPAINSNFSHHICAGLQDGSWIVGQNAISHPTPVVEELAKEVGSGMTHVRSASLDLDGVEDANLPGSLPMLRRQQIVFRKDGSEDLASRIQRIWYINPYGVEIKPAANPRVIDAFGTSNAIIYSIGSLYTSIIPCLILRNVGELIASGRIRHKILILNGSTDRETRSAGTPFDAGDFVEAIVHACHSSRESTSQRQEVQEWSRFITHLVHLEGEGAPIVDKALFRAKGIETLRVYGQKTASGMIYDSKALAQTLQAIIGKDRSLAGTQSRRNTLQH